MIKLTDSNGVSFYLNAIHVLSATATTDETTDYRTIIVCVEETTYRVQEDLDAVARVVSSALRSIGR